MPYDEPCVECFYNNRGEDERLCRVKNEVERQKAMMTSIS
jgi:hypothetical protein